MERLSSPYTIQYPQIVAVADGNGEQVELIEFFDCVGGAMWVKRHYAQSPLVRSVRTVGTTNRYILSAGIADLALEARSFRPESPVLPSRATRSPSPTAGWAAAAWVHPSAAPRRPASYAA